MVKIPKVTEKCCYIVSTIVLLILAILLPLILIQIGNPNQFVYLTSQNETDGYTGNNYKPEHNYFKLWELNQFLKVYSRNRSVVYQTTKIGTTDGGNPIFDVTLLKKDYTQKKVIVIIGGLSSIDWVGIWVMIETMEAFYVNFKTTRALINDFSFHFLPLVNPDGYNISTSLPVFSSWEKNNQGWNGFFPKGEKISKSFPNDISSTNEGRIIQEYLMGFKSNLKGVFLVHSEPNTSISYGYLGLHQHYFNSTETRYFKIVKTIADYNSKYSQSSYFKPALFWKNSTDWKDRLETWLERQFDEDPLLIINFIGNFQPLPPEVLEIVSKMRAIEIHYLIITLLQELGEDL